jgi:hypothetical protein
MALQFEGPRDGAGYRSPIAKTACEPTAGAIDQQCGCVFTPEVVQNPQPFITPDLLAIVFSLGIECTGRIRPRAGGRIYWTKVSIDTKVSVGHVVPSFRRCCRKFGASPGRCAPRRRDAIRSNSLLSNVRAPSEMDQPTGKYFSGKPCLIATQV